MKKSRIFLLGDTARRALKIQADGRGKTGVVLREYLAQLLIDIAAHGGGVNNLTDDQVYETYMLIAGNRGDTRRMSRDVLDQLLEIHAQIRGDLP